MLQYPVCEGRTCDLGGQNLAVFRREPRLRQQGIESSRHAFGRVIAVRGGDPARLEQRPLRLVRSYMVVVHFGEESCQRWEGGRCLRSLFDLRAQRRFCQSQSFHWGISLSRRSRMVREPPAGRRPAQQYLICLGDSSAIRMSGHVGGVLGPCPPFSKRAATGAVVALARPDDGRAAWIEPLQREHAAAEHARHPGAVCQNLGQPVAGARVQSGVTHNSSGSPVRGPPAARRCARRFPG